MMMSIVELCFFFNDTATTEIYTLSLHDALPISTLVIRALATGDLSVKRWFSTIQKELYVGLMLGIRSEEHTSELQSH